MTCLKSYSLRIEPGCERKQFDSRGFTHNHYPMPFPKLVAHNRFHESSLPRIRFSSIMVQLVGERHSSDASVFPNVHGHIHLSAHPACHGSMLPAVSLKAMAGRRKGINKIWLGKKPLILVKNFSPGIVRRRPAPDLGFSEIQKDKFT